MASSPTQYLVFCLALFFVFGTESRVLPESSMRQRYQEWRTRYGKQYTTMEESEIRYPIFAENAKRIDEFNAAAGDKTYTLGLNEYADLTDDEFQTSRKGFRTKGSSSSGSSSFRYEDVSVADLPSYLDWREKGAVTPVKNQGACGSCWAFSAVAAVEGIIKLRSGHLPSLSEQELVDCDRTNETAGCEGGWMDDAFQFIQNHGLSAEKRYPYQGTQNNCNRRFQPKITINGYEDVPANNETNLLKAVAHQPVSVAIDAQSFEFRYYDGGVFSGGGCTTTELDHAVTVVGYGETEFGVKYWIIKNSWGDRWGEEGYMRFLRDVDQPEGLCGIATKASYPTKHYRYGHPFYRNGIVN